MTPQSKARLKIGQDIASSFSAHPDVKTVFAFDSVGNGLADDYSDLEIGAIWSQPPEPGTLKSIAAKAGGKNWAYGGFHEPKLSYCDGFTKDGLDVEFAHWTTTIIDGIIDDIMIRHDVSKNMLMYSH